MIINLDKILKNAEENLKRDSQHKLDEHLSLFKKFLIVEEHRLKNQHRSGADGMAVCASRSYLIDVLIQHIYKFAAEEYSEKAKMPSDTCAVVAVGGYGRNELNPFSDIDIMFVYENKINDYVKFVVEKTLYILWDIGLTVGHGTRSIDDTIALTKQDVKSCSSVLEARFITGQNIIFDKLKDRLEDFLENNKKTIDSFINQKLAERNDRHARFGASMYLQEPNIKECIGGMRDLHNVFWLTMLKFQTSSLTFLHETGFLTEKEIKLLLHSYQYILRLRNELHYTANKKIDILTMSYQKKIAYQLGYEDKKGQFAPEIFMKEYYTHARNIAFITQNIISKFKTGTGKAAAARVSAPKEVMDGFLLIDNAIYLSDKGDEIFHKKSMLMLKIFLAAQEHNAVINEDLKSAMRNNLTFVEKSFKNSDEAAALFMKVFESPGKIGKSLRQMNEIGFLGKYIPEFGKIVCLVQDSYYHKYTADEHTLVAIENLDELFYKTDKYRDIFDSVKDIKILYLAILLHDIGTPDKSEGHVESSCEQAEKVLKRFPLNDEQIAKIILLIREHLSFSHIAQRRDLEDEKVFADMAKRLKDADILNMLMLLTYADAKAVSPGLWTEWKESLVCELYIKTKLQMTGKLSFAPEPKKVEEIKKKVIQILDGKIGESEIATHLEKMPKKYHSYTPPETIAEHLKLVGMLKNNILVVDKVIPDPPTAAEVTVCTHDKMGLFSMIAGSFTLNNINILSAQINTRSDGIVLDTFRTTDETGDPNIEDKRIKKFKETLAAAIKGEKDLAALLSEHRKIIKAKPFINKNISTMVAIDNSISDSKTVIEVESPDKLGLLYAISSAISSLKLDISFAAIHTEKGIAFDVFYVTETSGKKIVNEDRLNEIKVTLLGKLENR